MQGSYLVASESFQDDVDGMADDFHLDSTQYLKPGAFEGLSPHSILD